ncbi:MAG: exodeoxyribonuclease VII large subunit [Ignavibacteria bacterium]|jgi:exodeoxyribonuclease VII large subunit|nr:exodeoxyribonuclease VII large subunit [Ignavibacteria bacterium]MDH7528452.1 exodeoxyribonuclease VII large subunit [Ignavibacteria bacterium]
MVDQAKIYSVSEIIREIKILLETSFDYITVVGEISNFKAYQSGHWYFSLKDENSQISCVMWRGLNSYVFFTPQDGMKIIVTGRINVYEPRGSYQIEVSSMKPLGVGELQIAFEALKRKLAAEGLFDERFKKPIPKIPSRIGIVTSKDGAALRDVLAVIRRRFPVVEVVLAHTSVQGEGAANEISNALDLMNEYGEVDVIILCRGGGSLEDLWAFNEEVTARAIFRSKIPVVTGIGHEVDFTIADFVADLRAATPTAAAELVTPRLEQLVELLNEYDEALYKLIKDFLRRKKENLYGQLRSYSFVLPESLLNNNQQKFDFTFFRFNQSIQNFLNDKKQILKKLENTINLSDPKLTLSKGFAIVRQNDKIISRKSLFVQNYSTEIEFYDGKVKING